MIRMMTATALVLALAFSSACSNGSTTRSTSETGATSRPSEATTTTEPAAPELRKATFAGGCFWCMQKPFDKVPGVTETVVGYTGGTAENPTYSEVSSGKTDHVEAIEITYDPAVVTYDELLTMFWHNINPTQTDGQFADRADQYKTVIYYHSPEQKRAAEASKRELDESGKFAQPIFTKIRPASEFWRGEDYHQTYYKKNPTRYQEYYRGSGREAYLEKTWKD